MNPREKGFLLLTSRLGDPNRKVLSAAQLRLLAQRMSTMEPPTEDRDLSVSDLLRLGYGRETADGILYLLSQEDLLEYYLNRGRKLGCMPISRVSEGYPLILRQTGAGQTRVPVGKGRCINPEYTDHCSCGQPGSRGREPPVC